MNILLVEPFFVGSHQSWAEGLRKYSKHNISCLTLPGRHWKWRMHGGAISLARQFNQLTEKPDLILATDMLDLTTFLSLTRKLTADIPTALYFHENQFAYPWSDRDPDLVHNRDKHYSFINYISALAADKCYFNSSYNLTSFVEGIRDFKQRAPDNFETETIQQILDKSKVLPLGLELSRFDQYQAVDIPNKSPVILWNHRWEHDKNPIEFFKILQSLKAKNLNFKLIVLGERYSEIPKEFKNVPELFKEELIHFGYAEKFSDYAKLLWKADFLPVTSNQDFFGASIVEAIYCNTHPILPNRLSYSELVELEFIVEDLEAEIERLIKEFPVSKKLSQAKIVNKYDWLQLIAKYDQELSISL